MIKSRRIRWAGHVACMGENWNPHRFLEEKPEGKKSIGRPRQRWQGNINMGLRKIRWNGMNWIHLSPQPPYSPDLAPCDFALFPKLKMKLK
jgi:hypothetical protein